MRVMQNCIHKSIFCIRKLSGNRGHRSSKEKVFMIASHKRGLLTAALVVLALGGNQTFAQTRFSYDQIKIGILTDISGLCAVLAEPGSVEAGVRYTNAVAFADQIDRQ